MQFELDLLELGGKGRGRVSVASYLAYENGPEALSYVTGRIHRAASPRLREARQQAFYRQYGYRVPYKPREYETDSEWAERTRRIKEEALFASLREVAERKDRKIAALLRERDRLTVSRVKK